MHWQMRNQNLAAVVAVVLMATLIGSSGCRRKRVEPGVAPSVEQPAAEGAGASAAAPDPVAATSVGQASSGVPASHPGEAQNPTAIKLAMDQFERKFQRPPNDWQEMMDAKVLAGIPKRKDGEALEFSEFIEFYFHRGGNPGKR